MHFKSWIIKEERENLRSWLTPQGEFHPLKGMMHSHDALNFHSRTSEFFRQAQDDLLEKGWQRIATYEKNIMTNNPYLEPNRDQKEALINLAIEQNMSNITYDNDKNTKIIWDKSDKF
jgi:hypothetical protein